jgi:hypothetical protein
VQTELNFAVFKTLTEGGFIPPLGPGSSIVTIQGLDGMQDAMGEIARTFVRPSAPPVEDPGQDGNKDPGKRERLRSAGA